MHSTSPAAEKSFKCLYTNLHNVSLETFKNLLNQTHHFDSTEEGYCWFVLDHFKKQIDSQQYNILYDKIISISNGYRVIKSE